MENKCFAFLVKGRCRALYGNSSCGEKCPFYKTADQMRDELRRVYIRLTALDIDRQAYIANKYYNGERIWMEERECL
jgi:hypothetical protein